MCIGHKHAAGEPYCTCMFLHCLFWVISSKSGRLVQEIMGHEERQRRLLGRTQSIHSRLHSISYTIRKINMSQIWLPHMVYHHVIRRCKRHDSCFGLSYVQYTSVGLKHRAGYRDLEILTSNRTINALQYIVEYLIGKIPNTSSYLPSPPQA